MRGEKTMSEMENLINKYFRPGRLPHIWCPGCGNGVITGAIVKAIDKQGLAKDDVAVISGIGCSSRSSGYLDFNTANTLHGRALPIATGVKMANPALNVIVCSGDGDYTAIGGNHLIHAARRNIDLTLVVFNNSIYGMTGGQYSPMTPIHSKATTAPYYTVEPSFNLLDLAKAAGATYVARATTYHVPVLAGNISYEKSIGDNGGMLIAVGNEFVGSLLAHYQQSIWADNTAEINRLITDDRFGLGGAAAGFRAVGLGLYSQLVV
jgi:2-oxoglutarate/2-oxoacid ferredoxin oxidoreductase subunit beta